MKKKLLAIFMSLTLTLTAFAGCGAKGKPGDDDPPSPPDPPPPVTDTDFSYYPETKLAADKKIHLLRASNASESVMLQAIEGLFARDEVKFYFIGDTITNGTSVDEYYIEKDAEYYGLTLEETSTAQAVAMYKDAWSAYVADGTWGSGIACEDFNTVQGVDAYVEADPKGYETPGYILYKGGTMSLNVACTLAGLTGFLPVDAGHEQDAIALGLVRKFDVQSVALGYSWIYDAGFGEISAELLIHQKYDREGEANPFLKDYGICTKAFFTYYDSKVTAGDKFRNKLHAYLFKNTPILGYAYDEVPDVALFSQYGQFLVPTDYSYNLSYFAAHELKYDKDGNKIEFKQPNTEKESAITAQEGKKYVAFIFSDGDNATMWQNTVGFSTSMMNGVDRDQAPFNMTWSMTPSLADLAPSVLRNYYTLREDGGLATENDYFCAPVSGQAYVNPASFIKIEDGVYFADYLSRLDTYMKRIDQSVVTVMPDGGDWATKKAVYDGYASVDAVKGGVIYDGNKYFGGVTGGVYWSNGKPFVGPRDSLWETTPAYLAARVNHYYQSDIHSIEGYTLINVHPWSHTYADIEKIVSMFDDDVEVVSVDTLIRLIGENVTPTDTSDGYRKPAKNGVNVGIDELAQHPDYIPVDPLMNDFLLWQEDWSAKSGAAVRQNTSDAAASNVGAVFKTNLTIPKGTTAEKSAFTLPNKDDEWMMITARADSTDASKTAKFTMTVTVDGTAKVVVDNATLRGVQGTGTKTVTGDGWQFFAFPIKQYFPDYRGKTCSVEIAVDAASDCDIRIDRFCVEQRTIANNGPFDPYRNEFDNKNTEDWLLGYQFQTSQYYFWGAYNHETNKAEGKMEIDASDGGGNEKRNGNTNMFTAKHYTLPTGSDITLSWKIGGQAFSKISLYVGGKYVVLRDWGASSVNSEASFDLGAYMTETYGIDVSGMEATVVLEVRDSAQGFDGAGEIFSMFYFNTAYTA